MTVFDPLLHIHSCSKILIDKILIILSENFNIKKFYYYQINARGQLVLFESSLELIHQFTTDDFILKYPSFCHPRWHQTGLEMTSNSTDPLLQQLACIKEIIVKKMNLNLRIRFTDSSEEEVKEFGFDSIHTEKQCLFLSNHSTQLRDFCFWFLKNTKELLLEIENQPIDLQNFIGEEFNTNRIGIYKQELLDSRLIFLKDLGIESRFSLLEIKTILLLARKYTSSEISLIQNCSRRTAEHRIETIKNKLDCYSITEIAQFGNDYEVLLRSTMLTLTQ